MGSGIKMKYITFLLDGVADYAIEKLGGKTPLEFAHTPNLDLLAQNAVFGTFLSLPKEFPTSSDVANMSVLGWDLKKYYTGRGAIECFGAGYDMDNETVAFRMNLITVEKDILLDYSAGHISDSEARELILFLSHNLGNEKIEFKKSVSYRNLLFLKGNEFSPLIDYAKPDSSQGMKWREILPQSTHEKAQYTEKVLKKLIHESHKILKKGKIRQI
jgi:2,3-bisphosphoglycerate-independent phosphoglycerate mutase